MNLSEYATYDGIGLADLVRARQVSAKEVGRLMIQAAERVNPVLNCIIEMFPDRLASLDDGHLPQGPLSGVPMLLKDFYKFEKGVLSECGCELTRGLRGWYDSEVVLRMRRAGQVILGRTTVPELGWASACKTRLCGLTRNPWNVETYPGGSSSGAAVAVAARVLPIAHASDGGGSTRSPAAYCGLVGLKPTRGRVSDGPGSADPMAGSSAHLAVSRTVRDTAAMLDALQGPAIGDPHRAPAPERPFLEEVTRAPRPLTIAYTTAAFDGGPVDPSIVAAVEEVARLLESMGHRVENRAPKFDWERFMETTLHVWAAGMTYGCDALGARLGRKPGPDNLMRTTWATYRYGQTVTAQDYLAALDHYNTVRRDMGAFFETCDLLMTPTTSLPAMAHAVHDQDQDFDAPTWMRHIYQPECFLPVFNVTGQPAISLPLFETADHAQIGIHFVGRFGEDATVLRLSARLEEALPWKGRRPKVDVASI